MVKPNFPEKVSFTIDIRHPDSARLAELWAGHEETLRVVARRHRRAASWRTTTSHPPRASDPELVRVIIKAAAEQGIPATTRPSGAVPDAQRMAHIARLAMAFVRSVGCRSHAAAEFTTTNDAVAGIRVLAAGLRQLANELQLAPTWVWAGPLDPGLGRKECSGTWPSAGPAVHRPL